jgi:hypothetical protein
MRHRPKGQKVTLFSYMGIQSSSLGLLEVLIQGPQSVFDSVKGYISFGEGSKSVYKFISLLVGLFLQDQTIVGTTTWPSFLDKAIWWFFRWYSKAFS